MNVPLHPFDLDTQAAGEIWLARNDEVLELGFGWLRARLKARIADQREAGPPPAFGPDGTAAMSDLRADWLLREMDIGQLEVGDSGASEAIHRCRADYEAARQAMADAGAPCGLDLLAGVFGLAAFDLDVLLLAVAPQVDAGIGALYGYLHDRMPLCHATRHLITALLCPQPGARVFARARLSPEGKLRRHALIRHDGPEALAPITLDERMIGFIQAGAGRDPRLEAVLRDMPPTPTPDRLAQMARSLIGQIAAGGRAAAQVIGPRRSGRRAVAQAVAAGFGLTPVEIDIRALPPSSAERRGLFTLMAREAVLSRLCLVLDAAPETLGPDDPAAALAPLAAREVVAAGGMVTVLLSEDPVAGIGEPPLLRLASLPREDRLWGWTEAFAGRAIDPDMLDALVDHFPVGLSQMVDVAGRLDADTPADRRSLWAACRERAASRLEGLARRVEARRGWDDLVLPDPVLADIHAVADQVSHRGIVYGRWGYDALLPRGRGVSALFAGPSGVGKTLAAEVIAHELDLDLYCVDLAAVVSKYLGETEKNLKRIFDAAEEAGAVLFIDEADALFGKRSEVKDSHDRYANIEISYLLQRIEQYSGLAILATNMKSHIDFGFLRRLRYLIDIPFPGFAERQALWRKAFPPRAPLHDIAIDRLAALEIAGGNIIVIATNAAFLAAAEQTAIAMRHVEQAARAEFRKLDRLFDLPASRGGGL